LPIIQALQDLGVYRLALVCDLNNDAAKSACSRFGGEGYTHDAEEIFKRKDRDAVYVFGTAQMHYEYSKKALLSGKHVFVEKPPACPQFGRCNRVKSNGAETGVSGSRLFQSEISEKY